jgi:hypothetical protein
MGHLAGTERTRPCDDNLHQRRFYGAAATPSVPALSGLVAACGADALLTAAYEGGVGRGNSLWAVAQHTRLVEVGKSRKKVYCAFINAL